MTQYEKNYRQASFYWGKEPNQLAKRFVEVAGNINGKTLIDLGCGEGRDSIYFAKQGGSVTGMDLAHTGLVKAERWAKEESLSISTIQADIQSFRLEHPVDFIYSAGTLQYLPPHQRQNLFSHYKINTHLGGIHSFLVFIVKPWISPPPDATNDEYLYRSGELLQYYWDWNILYCNEYIFECHSSGVPHDHAVQEMIARKEVN
ncbi:methyltransferase domain-containing protein [Hazenella coriacea]|uniref:Tellurite methyltransferase n=1 Tax=Hazenella coriacea TaxID=1179467 RepID=A0A4R3LAU2_9BACL|nr:methyltransferase domain-containing protein [Hazenella coriacea]TCS96983.1 tellurite methyltransferase [Hazenella coriacea]